MSMSQVSRTETLEVCTTIPNKIVHCSGAIPQVNGGHNICIGTFMPTVFGTRSVRLLQTLTFTEVSGHYRHETNLGLCLVTRSILAKRASEFSAQVRAQLETREQCTYKTNTEERPRNHFCCGKTIKIKNSKYLSVAFGI